MSATFAVLGYGRFGRAFVELLESAGHSVRVVDGHAAVPKSLGATLAEALAGAQWVVLAVPVPALQDALRRARPLLTPQHIVIDVGSVKLNPCAWMDELLGDAIPHAGTHPLFGPLSLARGERPLRVVLCGSSRHPHVAVLTRQLFEQLGCDVIERDPASHDRAMAETHALAFYIAKALVEMDVGQDLSLAPPSFLGLANMLAAVRGDAGHLFAAIQQENPFADAARTRLLRALSVIHERLQREADGSRLAIPPAADTIV